MVRALVLALTAFAMPAFPAESCPVTPAPAVAFVPPAPYNSSPLSGGFRLGSASLWTFVSEAHDFSPLGYKVVYWHPGLSWNHTDETSHLTVVARRLDAPSAPIVFTHRANMVGHFSAEAPDEVAMMTGLDLPSGGCWEIAADYEGQRLSYVVSLR